MSLEYVSRNLNSRIYFHAYLEPICAGKIVCVVLLKKGCVKLNGTLLSKCIYIQNLIMLNGTLQDKYGEVLLAYIDSLVQLLWFYVTLCVYWFFSFW